MEKRRSVEYIEFGFQHFISEISELHQEIVTSEEFSIEEQYTLLLELISGANRHLAINGILGRYAKVTGATVPNFDNGEVEMLIDEDTIYGRYQGLGITRMAMDFEDCESLERLSLVHNILMHHVSVNHPLLHVEQKSYAYLPIESEAIQIIDTPSMHLANEHWVKSVTSKIRKNDSINVSDVNEAFDRILNVKRPAVPHAKMVDWFLDFLNEDFGLTSQYLQIAASEAVICRPDSRKSIFGESYAYDGQYLGFSTQEGEDENSLRLVINLETADIDGQPCLIQIPFDSCMGMRVGIGEDEAEKDKDPS